MTIPASEPQKVTANGNGVATTFSFSPMVLFEADDLVVTHVTAAGVETVIPEGTGASAYAITVSSYPGTGSITYPEDEVTPLPSGEKLVMKAVLTLEQETDLENQGGYFPDTLETQMDKVVKQNIQQQEELDRAAKLPIGVSGVSAEFPVPVADRLLGWNSSAAAITNLAAAGNLATTAFTETLLDDASGAAFRNTLLADMSNGELVQADGTGAEALAAGASGTIVESNGTKWIVGTAAAKKATLTTKGDIYAASAASTPARLAVGSNYTLLGADSSETAGLKYFQVQPFSRVSGLRIDYAASVADQAVITAKEVTLWNPTTGETYTTNVTTDITLDVDESQSVSEANKRDQASAFGSSATIHVYYIWNGSTLATLASIAGGDAFNPWTTGPTLPSGYTHYCYLGTTISDGSGEFVRHHQRGCRIYRGTATAMVSGGSATTFTAVNQGTWVPQTAMNFEINVSDFGGTRSGSGQADFQVQLSIDATNIYANLRGFFDGLGASNNSRFAGASFTLPNWDATGTAVQQFWYKVVNTLGTSCSTTINIGSFTVPNGDN